ncbi:MAG TPA: tetratricopeptide repeat protein [Vicinamibacteria bacterium]|nr:tetratricopeptide repeat protein [Vicinamibacteria bacterium]
MKRILPALAVLAFLAAPAAAQSKLDQAISKAYEQLQKGKPDDAVKTLSKAAAEAGPEGQLALARLQERIGNLEAAEAAYTQARSAGASADVLAAVSQFTLRAGTGKDALAVAKQAVAAGATPAALAAEARALVRCEDGPGGLVAADKAVAAGPSSPIAYVARGEALNAVGRNAEAESALRKAVELDPKSPLAWSRLSRALLVNAKSTEAVAAARKATELDDKFGEAFAALGGAIAAENPKNWSDAIAQAQQGAFLDPKSPIVQLVVGKVFEANGQLEQAAGAYRRALQNDGGFAPARLALIQAELNRGNRDAALAEAKKAAADMPTSPDIQLLIGEMSVRKGDFAEALGFLERAMKGLPGNADGWALLGRSYHGVRRYDDAADAYGKAVQLAPMNLNYQTTYGLVLGQAGDLEKGLAVLQKVTGTPGYKDAVGWVNLGWVYRNMNKATESIAAYQKALALDPKQEQAALGLGWAYQYTKEYDKAIAAYEQAMKIDPKDASADANLGIAWCHFFKRQVPEARAAMEKAAAAGRSVTQLKENVDKLEKALASGAILDKEMMEKARAEQQAYEERSRQVEAADNAARAKNPQTRARAAAQLAAVAGPSSVPTLIFLMQSDPNYDVRIAAANALGSLGAAARQALPNIDGVLRQPPYEPPINATAEQLDAQMKDGDYRRALRDAKAKIGR